MSKPASVSEDSENSEFREETDEMTDETSTEEETSEENVSDEPTDDSPASKEDEISQLKAELQELKDKALRSQAEMINFRKRQEKERSTWNQMTLKDFISALLDPFDNLERTIEAASSKEDQENENKLNGLIEGVKMVQQQLSEVLERKNVVILDPKGEKFNPNEHEAFGQIETDEVDEGHVAAVFRKGYKIGETLIRTATVQVAKAPEEKDDEK